MSRPFQFHFERLLSRTLLSHGFGALDSFDKIERNHVRDHEQVEVRSADKHHEDSESQQQDELRWTPTDSLTIIESSSRDNSGKTDHPQDEEEDKSGSRESDSNEQSDETITTASTDLTVQSNDRDKSESEDHDEDDSHEDDHSGESVSSTSNSGPGSNEHEDSEDSSSESDDDHSGSDENVEDDSHEDDHSGESVSSTSNSGPGSSGHEDSEDSSSSESDDDHSGSDEDVEDDSDEDEHSGESVSSTSNSGPGSSGHEDSEDSSSESDDDHSGSETDDDHFGKDDDDQPVVNSNTGSNSGPGDSGTDGSDDASPDGDNDDGEIVDSSGPGSGTPPTNSTPDLPPTVDGGTVTETNESPSPVESPKSDDHTEVTSVEPTESSTSDNAGSTASTSTESENNPSANSNPDIGPIVLPGIVNNAGGNSGTTVVSPSPTITPSPTIPAAVVTSDSPEVPVTTTTTPVISARAGNASTSAPTVASNPEKSPITTSIASASESDDAPAILTNSTADKKLPEQRTGELANNITGTVATRANGNNSAESTNSPERNDSNSNDSQSPQEAATDDRIADIPLARLSTPVTTAVPTTSPVWTKVPQWLVESLASLESTELFPTTDQLEKVWDDAHSLVDQTSDLFVESGSLSWLLAGGATAALVISRRGTKASCDDRPWLELAPGLVDDAFTK